MIHTPDKSFTAGKFLVSPSSRCTDSGRYAATLSIRSGRGTGTHDRVFRFLPHFETREQALCFALAQGHDWLRQRAA